jgi:hypothetical protein
MEISETVNTQLVSFLTNKEKANAFQANPASSKNSNTKIFFGKILLFSLCTMLSANSFTLDYKTCNEVK